MNKLTSKRWIKAPLAIAILAAQFSAIAYAHEEIEEVTITGVKQKLYDKGMLGDTIQKTEVIGAPEIQHREAVTLNEAISRSAGVRVSNECSMCGVKRVMLNGLRGEHTTVLIDGIPAHTMMSGFYALDAASTAGIERVEIARGAGASLSAPEAIGGSINLITKVATENGGALDVAAGEHGYQKTNLVGTLLGNEDATRLTLIGQIDQRDQYDGDDNGLSENPLLDNQSLTARLSQDINDKHNLSLRLSHINSEIFGGPMGHDIDSVLQSYNEDPSFVSDHLFEDDDVRNQYLGKPWESTEWIDTSRDEATASWLSEVSDELNIAINLHHTTHKQDSFYEGFIYKATDKMTYVDTKINYAINAQHLFTVGIDQRDETLDSTSNSTSEDYVSDSFDYLTQGVFIQDTWNLSENVEIVGVLRADFIEADFTDPKKSGTEIDENLLSPRIDARITHNDQFTSRLSYGQGYRAPLSFFESDHGILDAGAGFLINIDSLEKSNSFNYALSFEGEKLSISSSVAYTELDNMATLSETDEGIPVLDQATTTAEVIASDIAVTYRITDTLSASSVLEWVHYNDTFKQAFGVVPIEQRIGLEIDWHFNKLETHAAATWVASRDLSEFGTPAAPSFDVDGNLPKSTRAPSYWVIDLQSRYNLNESWSFYAGAKNLLDYTQVNDMETPLFYEEGGFDVAHIYGPLRGREFYAGIKWTF